MTTKHSFFILILLSLNLLTLPVLSQQQDTVMWGNYQSLKGTKNDLSCYCYNCGYLHGDDGQRIPVCFDQYGKDSVISCDMIYAMGRYVEKDLKSDNPTNACPEGKKGFYMIKDYKCIKTYTGILHSASYMRSKLSCFCSNIATLTLESGEEIPLCVEQFGDVAFENTKAKIWGVLIEKENRKVGICPNKTKPFIEVLHIKELKK